MRRADREVTDVNEIIDIIDHCKVCHIALMDGEWPYIVAMNFAYRYENDQLVIYLHSAKEGKKLDLLRKDDHVCFEMDYDHEMIPAKYACAVRVMPSVTVSVGVVCWVPLMNSCMESGIYVRGYRVVVSGVEVVKA